MVGYMYIGKSDEINTEIGKLSMVDYEKSIGHYQYSTDNIVIFLREKPEMYDFLKIIKV